MVRAAVAASGVVLAAWVVLIAITDPTSDPQAPVAYVFWTVCAVGALLLIWLVVLAASIIRRFANRDAKLS
jgi:nitrogen fixation/metabolism regulation signal transduction histidine kinase